LPLALTARLRPLRREKAPFGDERKGNKKMTVTSKKLIASLLLATAFGHAALAAGAAPLPELAVDRTQIAVAGFSSGGYMAVQLHVAYSATFKGAGVIGGGPYNCAEGNRIYAMIRCMANDNSIPVERLVATTRERAGLGQIDPVVHLSNAKVYLFEGARDTVIKRHVFDALLAYYQQFVAPANIAVKRDIAAEHAMVTDDFGNDCAAKALPFISDCDFDLAGALVGHLFGPLQPRNNGAATGTLVEFDQTAFIRGHGMAESGWLYVPQTCGGRAGCRLIVVLHGCKQNAAEIGQKFVRHGGYNRWADSNHLVVLYPQTSAQAPNGCWDWLGYDSDQYTLKAAPQMSAIKAMVDRVAGPGARAAAANRRQ
jgi:poly(3-hydroxybutyrate) depolymerase